MTHFKNLAVDATVLIYREGHTHGNCKPWVRTVRKVGRRFLWLDGDLRIKIQTGEVAWRDGCLFGQAYLSEDHKRSLDEKKDLIAKIHAATDWGPRRQLLNSNITNETLQKILDLLKRE